MRNDKKHTFHRVKQVLFSILVGLIVIDIFVLVTQGRNIPVLNPHGLIAEQQRNLILLTTGLGLLIIVPVFIMLFSIAWRYRASNTKAKYQPDFESHRGFEALWWGIPCAIIIILGAITVVSTHALDPYKPIDSQVTPVNVQVVSLNWKWLFIYPDQHIATLNYLNIPKDTPISLTITSDATMNSFWVPALAGQVYAMSGMSTQLHLIADGTGNYVGSSANISGEGFADMTFKVNSMNETDFASWAKKTASTGDSLTSAQYDILSKPSRGDPETAYKLVDTNLYNEIIMKYMAPNAQGSATSIGTSH
jgi:cytochrome o ubiquinol oxidase subunit 2